MPSKNSMGLRPEERDDPHLAEVVRICRDLTLLDQITPAFYALRDERFLDAVLTAGDRGPGRGLSLRLGAEAQLAPLAVKTLKARAQKRRQENRTLTDLQAKAAAAALHAAADAYREVMAAGHSAP